MPYNPTSTTAVHALDPIQLQAANQQYSWTSGCAVSLSSSTTTIETTLTPGTVVIDGETISIGSVTVAHTDGDTTFPRWDAVCVTDRTGTVEAIAGLPAEPVEDQNGVPVRGEEAFKPSPSDNITDEMVCLAIVWIPAGATTNSDLTDTSNGGVPEPVVDRRVYQQGQVTQTSRRAVINSSGWYRIAAVGNLAPSGLGDRADGLITIRDTQTGLHSSTTVNASCVYSDHALTLLNSAAFTEPHGAVEGVRIVSGTTNDGAAVDVDVQLGGQTQVDFVEYTIQNNGFPTGWEPVEWESATVPAGYQTSEIDFVASNHMLGGVGLAGDRDSWYVDHDGAMGAKDLSREQVATKVTLSANQVIPNTTNTEVAFDQVVFDDYGAFTGNTSITAPVTGTYLCDANINWGGLPAGSYSRMDIEKNNTSIVLSRGKPFDGGIAMSTDTIEKLNAGDTLTLQVYHDAGADEGLIAGREDTYLAIARLG